MLKGLLARVWRGSPVFVKRAGVWLTQSRFAVTAGAVISDEGGRVLLLRHVLRRGSGWGIPGGFLNAGEETGLELDGVELAFVRSLPHVRQVEVIFRASMSAARLGGLSKSFEIDRA